MTKKVSRPNRRAIRRLSIAQKQYENMCKIGKPIAYTKPGKLKHW